MEAFSEEKMEKERKRIEISTEIRRIRSNIVELNNSKKKPINKFKIKQIDEQIVEQIEAYKQKRIEIKQYLPEIKDLLEDGILFVIISLHGLIPRKPKDIKIPDSMVFFKTMSSDYGTVSCDFGLHGLAKTLGDFNMFSDIKQLISRSIQSRKGKGTRRNNIKFMKENMKHVIKIMQDRMTALKASGKSSNLQDKRFADSSAHAHYYEHGGNIVEKTYQITLSGDDDYDRIYVVNKKYDKLNLVDYIDVDIDDSNDFMNIKMINVFNLFKDIKYVFLADLSCSSSDSSNANETMRIQYNAEQIEGESITDNIEQYVNTSPYNTNSAYERELLENKKPQVAQRLKNKSPNHRSPHHRSPAHRSRSPSHRSSQHRSRSPAHRLNRYTFNLYGNPISPRRSQRSGNNSPNRHNKTKKPNSKGMFSSLFGLNYFSKKPDEPVKEQPVKEQPIKEQPVKEQPVKEKKKPTIEESTLAYEQRRAKKMAENAKLNAFREKKLAKRLAKEAIFLKKEKERIEKERIEQERIQRLENSRLKFEARQREKKKLGNKS